MFQHEGDGRGVEADIQRVQHGARHRHTEMALQHLRRVRSHDGHGVALAYAAPGKRIRKHMTALARLFPGEPAFSMHDRRVLRKNPGGALQE